MFGLKTKKYYLEFGLKKVKKAATYLRDAWTWEDIRLYLKNKGFIINVHYWENNHEDYAIRLPYTISIYRNGLVIEEDYPDYSNTYEEARKDAIIYCLNLINNGHNTINT